MAAKIWAFVAFLAAISILRAEAGEIEISPEAMTAQSPLFLRNQPSSTMVILLQEPAYYSALSHYPAGCFNCGTLPSNRSNLSSGFYRSHSMSQDLYKPNPGAQILYIR